MSKFSNQWVWVVWFSDRPIEVWTDGLVMDVSLRERGFHSVYVGRDGFEYPGAGPSMSKSTRYRSNLAANPPYAIVHYVEVSK